ncbi:MAG: hypothetical protein KAI81_04890, partial [Candidatus Marinimicrobia bacterium]|nr:hypothetical protein [Candidatus Neomarinimicrobiota bacterium]
FFNINFIYRTAEDIENSSSPFYDPDRHFYDGTIDSVYFSFFVDPDLPGRYLKPGAPNYQASPWAEDDYGLIYDYDGDGKIDIFLAHDKQDYFADEKYPGNTGPVSAYGINFFKTPKIDPGDPNSLDIGITGFHWFDQDNGMRDSPVTEDLEKTFYAISAGMPQLISEERRDLWFHGSDPQMDDISLLAAYQEDVAAGSRPDIQFWFSSGPFSISPGDTIPIHIGIVGGQPVPGILDAAGFPTNLPKERFKSIFDALSQADTLYQNSFIGYRPPSAPVLQAVGTLELDKSGIPLYMGENGKVRLYWDNSSEKSFEVISREHDFQGYKLYKTIVDLDGVGETDWGDEIYSYDGDLLGYKPLCQYDLIDSWEGYDPFDPWFNLGDNSGLVYEYIDDDVIDGVRYRYTITAYDHPILEAGQSVLESSRGTNPNLVQTIDIIPGLQAQGYNEGMIDSTIEHVSGTGTGYVGVKAHDPMQLSGDNYEISFNGAADSLSINIYNQTQELWVLTENKDYFNESTMVDPRYSVQFDGLSLELINHDKIEFLDRTWLNVVEDTSTYYFTPIFQAPDSLLIPGDYLIVFGDSTKKLIHPSVSNPKYVPFQVFNINIDPQRLDPLEIYARNPLQPWTSDDWITILEPDLTHNTWQFTIFWNDGDIPPSVGDEFLYRSKKSFIEDDIFVIKSHAYTIDTDSYDLNKIKTVPNPYIVSNITEHAGTRADQFIQNMRFTHLPPKCRIRIYTIRGDHVATLHHESNTIGNKTWNLQSKERLKISYGVYVYIVDTPEGDSIIKKFAVVH